MSTEKFFINNATINVELADNFLGRLRGLMNGSRLAKIAEVLISIAFTALMFFIAIPILFVLLAVGIALLVLVKILK